MYHIKRHKLINLLLIITALFCLLFLRQFLMFVYPLLVFLIFVVLKLKVTTKQFLFLSLLFVVTLISSYLDGFFIENYIFSLYLILPTFIFLTSKVTRFFYMEEELLFKKFFNYFTIILAIVNVSAFIYSQFLISPDQNFEDSFTGLYGSAGLGSHTFSIINLCVCVYYFYNKKILKFLLFLICGVFGFYGLGLMAFIAAFSLVFLTNILKHWKAILLTFGSVLIVMLSIYLFNPKNFRYLEKNINYAQLAIDDYSYQEEMDKVNENLITRVPRFITFLDGAQKRLFSDSKVFFIGTSPGGYNSRVAFFFNGDFMSNKLIKNSFNNRTKYHQVDVYPLLNRTLLERPYNDGTRNQTFSSITTMIMEYGVIIGGIFLVWFFVKIKRIRKQTHTTDKALSQYVKFLGFYLFILFFVQNYLEYPEIVLPIILFIKLIDIDNHNKELNEAEQE